MDEKSSWPCMTSLDECMQARVTRAHLFYLSIDDFDSNDSWKTINTIFDFSCSR